MRSRLPRLFGFSVDGDSTIARLSAFVQGVAEGETDLLRQTIGETPGVKAVHDIRTRKMGDLIVPDAHIEVDAMLTVEARRRAKSRRLWAA